MPRSKSLNRCARAHRTQKFHARQGIDEAIRAYDPSGKWLAYWRLVHTLREQSDLLSPRRARHPDLHRIALGCKRLATDGWRWTRMPESWQPSESRSLHVQWCEFVGHLLHEFDSPAFFAPSWLKTYQECWERELHFHIGSGKSIRQFELPSIGKVTKSVARWFMQAPVHAEVAQAIRWAQARAAGADEKLAAFLMTELPISPEDGWEENADSLIAFLIRNQPICSDEMMEIVRFVVEQRFKPARQTVGAWMGSEPVDRELDVRRWSLRRLRRHMAHWREAFPVPSVANQLGWYPSQYKPLTLQYDDETWTITELCTPRELRMEGRMMRHCVATYERFCRKGECAIWSLRRKLDDHRVRSVVTIDVDPNKDRILDAKGKANTRPSDVELAILGAWAKREGLTIAI